MINNFFKKLGEKSITFNNKPITVRGASINWLIIAGLISILTHSIMIVALFLWIYYSFVDTFEWIQKIDAVILFREFLAAYPTYSKLVAEKMYADEINAFINYSVNLTPDGISLNTITKLIATEWWKGIRYTTIDPTGEIQWIPLTDTKSITLASKYANVAWRQTMLPFHENNNGWFKIYPEFLLGHNGNFWFYPACCLLLLMIAVVFFQLFLLDEILLVFVSLDLIFTILATLFAITGLISNNEAGIIFFFIILSVAACETAMGLGFLIAFTRRAPTATMQSMRYLNI